MRSKSILVVAVMVSAACTISTSFANTVSFQGLGDLAGGGFYSQAYGVSPDGSVVIGFSRSTSSTYGEAFRWTLSGGMQPLGDLPGGEFRSNARGASANGSFIVGYSDSGADDHGEEAFIWTQSGGMEGMGYLAGGSYSCSFDVSADGSVVVGYSDSSVGTKAFRWTESGGMQDIGPANYSSCAYGVSSNGSVVVGELNGGQAFRWENNVMVGLGDLPGGDFYSTAFDASTDGSVVVGYSCVGLVPEGDGSFRAELEAFRWTESGGMVGLGDLPGGYLYSGATGVSADGAVIVGWSDTGLGGSINEAFIYNEQYGMRNLKTVLENDFDLNLTGWTLIEAMDISDNGLTIVGYGINPYGYTEAWIATIPEPATIILFGLGGLALLRRRKG